MKLQKKTDRLSQLPGELIINILSRLTLQESGRTSVLSHRWKNLWLSTNHCSGSSLIFKDLHIFECGLSSFERKRPLFVGLLNKVFEFNQQELLDELVISSHLTLISSTTIDNWINFALTKSVQRLELALSLCDLGNPYAFPSLHNFRGFGVHRLRALCLKGIDVDQTALDSLFSTCPLLDTLSLKPWKLQNLNFSSAKLKHLELSCLDSNYSINRYEISAPNLVSFSYEGKVSALRLNCIPSLSEFYVRDQDHRPFFTRFNMHFSYIDRLKKLKLNLGVLTCLNIGTFYPLDLPVLVNLEEFEVKFWGFDGDLFLWPTIFIKASPFLSRFSVEMDVISSSSIGFSFEEEKRRIKEVTKFRHGFLKAVEISGFSGYNCEIELAQHLVDIGAQSLEQMAVCSTEGSIGHHSEVDKRRIKAASTFQHRFLKVLEIIEFNGSDSEIELVQHLIDIGAQSLKRVVIDTRSPLRDNRAQFGMPIKEAQHLKKLAESIGQGLDSSVIFQTL